MNERLQRAIADARIRPEAEQDVLAALTYAQIEDEQK